MNNNADPAIDLYLASRSPRRAELLRQLGLRFACVAPDIDEVPQPGQAPADYALGLALAKAAAAARLVAPAQAVLAADTDVAVDGCILGKPRDREDALAILARLSDRSHQVVSAVALRRGERVETALTVTEVCFGPIGREQASAYWATGEPADKAGAYAIQGLAARWVKSIQGSYTGVVGLPLYETCTLLARFGLGPDRLAA